MVIFGNFSVILAGKLNSSPVGCVLVTCWPNLGPKFLQITVKKNSSTLVDGYRSYSEALKLIRLVLEVRAFRDLNSQGSSIITSIKQSKNNLGLFPPYQQVNPRLVQ